MDPKVHLRQYRIFKMHAGGLKITFMIGQLVSHYCIVYSLNWTAFTHTSCCSSFLELIITLVDSRDHIQGSTSLLCKAVTLRERCGNAGSRRGGDLGGEGRESQ